MVINNKKIIFANVKNAFDILKLGYFRSIINDDKIYIKKIKNGKINSITVGNLIIYGKTGNFEQYGHVTIIVDIDKDYVYIGEQNISDIKWNENYARKLIFKNHKLMDTDFKNAVILGIIKC